MLEPLVEGGGCLVALALLLYFQVWRPSREAAARPREMPPDPSALETGSGEEPPSDGGD